LYLVEFTDWDPSATIFHKVGIGVLDAISRPLAGGCDRLYRHVRAGASLLSSYEGNLLSCLTTEQLILKHVAERSYTPTDGRIRGGDTECFLPGEPINLRDWVS
jgi:hypothetical protein